MCLQLDLNYDGLRRLFQEKKGLDLIDDYQTVQLLDPARAWAWLPLCSLTLPLLSLALNNDATLALNRTYWRRARLKAW